MREILFRGKDKDGNWHYGAYGVLGENTDIERHVILESTFSQGYFDRVYFKNIEVIPETVGQFTGINGKNGVKIFEGDIVSTRKGVCVITHKEGCYYAEAVPECSSDELNTDVVLGSIYDNPELSK